MAKKNMVKEDLRVRYKDKMKAANTASSDNEHGIWDPDSSQIGESVSSLIDTLFTGKADDAPVGSTYNISINDGAPLLEFEEYSSGESSSADISTGSGNSTYQSAGQQVAVKSGSFYPTINAAGQRRWPNMQGAYKNHAVDTYSSFSFGTDYYKQHGQIARTTASHNKLSATLVRYIQSCGGVHKSPYYAPMPEDQLYYPYTKQQTTDYSPHPNYLRTDLIYFLQELLKKCNAKGLGASRFTITSGYRCPEHNWKVYNGNTKNMTYWSLHMGGIAVDISAPSRNEKLIIMNTAYAMGFGCISHGKNFIHLDIGPKRSHNYGYGKYVSPSNTGL